MSKAIKVDDQVYNELDTIRGKGETFSQIIAELIGTRVTIFEFINILEGKVKYHEWREKRLRELSAVVARGDRPEVSDVRPG